ncbi:CxxxxCH/CxxCH domain-containing protein, partial [Geobacter pelophilus]|nr:CxxxxCH/CxxCH domain-containing protein [Geoanaerobacter pelophilus]
MADKGQAANIIHKAINSGAPDFKYGTTWGSDYACSTCHQRGTANIKKIRNNIVTPLGIRRVVFNRLTTAGNYTNGIFGNDERLVNQNNSSNICEVCHHKTMYHLYSSSKVANRSHPEHKSNRGDCTQCHQHGRAFARPNAKDCGSCHGNPPVTNSDYGGAAQGLSAPATLLLGGTPSAPPEKIGAHDRHRNKNGFECSVCHNGDIDIYHGYLGNGYVELGFKVDQATWPPFTGSITAGTFTGYSSNSTRAKYAVAPGNPGTILRSDGNLATANTCAIYCHGDNWNIPSGRTGPSVSWTQGPLGSCENSSCHGSSVQNPPTPVFGGVSTGAHKTHVGKLGNAGERCGYCHDNYYSSSIHMVNGHVKINLAAFSPIAGYKGFNQMSTGYLATTGSYGNCTDLYCHSAVQSDSGRSTGGTYKTVAWGGGYLLCGECHGGRRTDSVKISTGSHTTHINDYRYGCPDCHLNSGKDNPLKHGDSNIDVAFSTTYGGSYSQSSNPAGNGYGSCSANYCHSEGTVFSGSYSQLGFVGWTSGSMPLACNACHSGGTAGSKIGPIYSGIKANSHNKHQFSCDNCHSIMVNASGTITNKTLHVNKAYDVLAGGTSSFDAVIGNPVTATTCSNINCHFSKSATWGAIIDCNGCHGSDAVTLTSKKHPAHLSPAANISLGKAIGCAECHAKTVNIDNVTINSQSVHVNGIMGDYSGSKAGRYTAATGICSNVYCHSDGKGKQNVPFEAGSGWNSAYTITDCKRCHGNDTSPD